jgi:hypothetical protein
VRVRQKVLNKRPSQEYRLWWRWAICGSRRSFDILIASASANPELNDVFTTCAVRLRSMNMGNIASPSPYDMGTYVAPLWPKPRQLAIPCYECRRHPGDHQESSFSD